MDEEELMVAAAFCLWMKTKKRKKRVWVKQWLLNRVNNSHVNLMHQLSLEPADWRNYMRMDEPTYFHLLELVTPFIKKEDTHFRPAISPHERLSATLRFLASGCTYEELKYPTAISPQRLGVIIPDTCRAILLCLKEYMKMPKTEDEWRSIAQQFEEKWQFPHCLGAVDGKHVRITPPAGSGSFFWNYKHFHSVVLMACANANYEFIWCEVGTNGRISDGGAIKNTEFFEKLISGLLKIPPTELCSGTSTELPYVFVGDEAFALRSDFLKPFSQRMLTQERHVFNRRLSRARRVVENVFGILANRFRIFHTNINLSVDRIDLVVLTCCILHNFLRKQCATYSVEEEYEDLSPSSETFPGMQVTQIRNSPTHAKLVRQMFLEYFNGEGELEWMSTSKN